MARSDYRTAGETMATYCYNLGLRVWDEEYSSQPLVPVKALRDQAEICLSAINAYSLIDEQLAFFQPRSPAARTLHRGKRQVDPGESGSTGGRPKHFKADASTMGWEVTAAPALDASATKAPSKAVSGDGGRWPDAGNDDVRSVSSEPGIVTIAMLRKHYALLRQV